MIMRENMITIYIFHVFSVKVLSILTLPSIAAAVLGRFAFFVFNNRFMN